MKVYDYSFLKTDRISNNVLSLLVSIEKIQAVGMINSEMYPKVFSNLRDISKTQSVKASNAIDGIFATDKRIESLIDKHIDPVNRSEGIILGYSDVINEIFTNYDSFQFNEYIIRDFHKTLLLHTGLNSVGAYKDNDILFTEDLPNGTRKVILNPVSSQDTNGAMELLVRGFKEALDDRAIPRLLLIPCVIFDFLCIQPFSEGNGRISRLLSLLLLFRNEYNVGEFVSFEKQINNYKSEYYESIRLSSINWDDNSNDYNPFIENFLESLYSCHIELNSRFRIVDNEKKSKKFRIEETIKKSWNPISRKEIHLVWPDISHETIKKVIKNLLNEQKIKKIGNFKDARYKRNWYGKTTHNEDNMVIF